MKYIAKAIIVKGLITCLTYWKSYAGSEAYSYSMIPLNETRIQNMIASDFVRGFEMIGAFLLDEGL